MDALSSVSGLHFSPSPLSLPVCWIGPAYHYHHHLLHPLHSPSLSNQNRPVPAKMTCPPYGKHGLFILYRERESDFFPDLCPSTLPLLIMMFLRSFKFMATLGFCTPSSLHVGLSAPETASFLSARARLKSFSLEQISPSTLPPCLLPHGPLSHSPVFFFVVSRIINIQNPYYK